MTHVSNVNIQLDLFFKLWKEMSNSYQKLNYIVHIKALNKFQSKIEFKLQAHTKFGGNDENYNNG
jgi:hypothetical protein